MESPSSRDIEIESTGCKCRYVQTRFIGSVYSIQREGSHVSTSDPSGSLILRLAHL